MKEITPEYDASMVRILEIAEHTADAVGRTLVESAPALRSHFNANESEVAIAFAQALAQLLSGAVGGLAVGPHVNERKLKLTTAAVFADLNSLMGRYVKWPK